MGKVVVAFILSISRQGTLLFKVMPKGSAEESTH